MDNLKNVRISMFDRTNNSSQPVNVVTSANAVIVDGEEKNIKEYVDSNNLINTHISPKVDFGKYTTESDLFGENINEVVSEFIQHYTGGGSNEPSIAPVPTLPMPGLTPAASTAVPVEFTKRVEALETKLAAIESKGNSTSSTKPASELMFDYIEDIFPLQLNYKKNDINRNYSYDGSNTILVKSDILIVPEQCYFNDGFIYWKKNNKLPMLCIKFKDGVPYDKKQEIISKLKVELYVKTGTSFKTTPDFQTIVTHKYNKYLYDVSGGLNSFGVNEFLDGIPRGRRIIDDSGKNINENCTCIRLTNKEMDQSTSEFKYNVSYIYSSPLDSSNVVDDVENGNVIISLNGDQKVYKKLINTAIVPMIYTEFNNIGETLRIIDYETKTKEKNTEFLDKFFNDSYNPRDKEIPENLLFDNIYLELPNEDNIIGDNYNTFVEDFGNMYKIHYIINCGRYSGSNDVRKFAIAISNTIKKRLPNLPDGLSINDFIAFINGVQIHLFDNLNSPLSAGFQVQERPIITRNGVFFVYGPNKINYGQIENFEFIVSIPKVPNVVMVGSKYLREMPNNKFKERVIPGEDYL